MTRLQFSDLNKTQLPVIDGVLSFFDNSMDEQRDAFSFVVLANSESMHSSQFIMHNEGQRAGSNEGLTYESLKAFLSDSANTSLIMLSNEVPFVDENGETHTQVFSEAFSGYTDLVSIEYQKRKMNSGLLNVAPAYEWVYKVTLAEPANSQYKAAATDKLLAKISDEEAGEYLDAFPVWSAMGQFCGDVYTNMYAEGYRVRYRELLYKCVTAHEIRPSTIPDEGNPADNAELWVCISQPSEEWPVWRTIHNAEFIMHNEGQNTQGSEDKNTRPPNGGHPLYERGLGAVGVAGYSFGDKVTHNGRRWVSVFSGVNDAEPTNTPVNGVKAWEEVV